MLRPSAAASAEIVVFPAPVSAANDLTTVDRIEALQWEASQTGARLGFHRWSGDGAGEGGDYISIYANGDRWAVWGAARRGRFVCVWRCATGADLGHYPTMREALAAVSLCATRLQA